MLCSHGLKGVLNGFLIQVWNIITAPNSLRKATKFISALIIRKNFEIFPKKILRKNLKKLENFEKNLEKFFYDKSSNEFCGLPEAIWCSYYVPNLNLKTVEYPLKLI